MDKIKAIERKPQSTKHTHTHTPPYSRRNEYGISLGHPIKKKKEKKKKEFYRKQQEGNDILTLSSLG